MSRFQDKDAALSGYCLSQTQDYTHRGLTDWKIVIYLLYAYVLSTQIDLSNTKKIIPYIIPYHNTKKITMFSKNQKMMRLEKLMSVPNSNGFCHNLSIQFWSFLFMSFPKSPVPFSEAQFKDIKTVSRQSLKMFLLSSCLLNSKTYWTDLDAFSA